MDEYFVKTNESGRVQGPFSLSQLRALAAAGNLKPAHLVSPDKKNWFNVEKAAGLLFEESPPIDEDVEPADGMEDLRALAHDLAQKKGYPQEDTLLADTSVSDGCCPSCGSRDYKKVSLIYEQGTQAGTVIGLGTDGDSLGMAGGVIQSRSLLASRLAPPKPGQLGCLISVLFVIAGPCLIGTCISLWAAISGQSDKWVAALAFATVGLPTGIAAVYFYCEHKEQNEAYLALSSRWERSWICLKCGHRWMR